MIVNINYLLFKLLFTGIIYRNPSLRGDSTNLFCIKDETTLEGCFMRYLVTKKPKACPLYTSIFGKNYRFSEYGNFLNFKWLDGIVYFFQCENSYFWGIEVADLIVDQIMIHYIPELKPIRVPIRTSLRNVLAPSMQSLTMLRIHTSPGRYNTGKALDLAIEAIGAYGYEKTSLLPYCERILQKAEGAQRQIKTRIWQDKIYKLAACLKESNSMPDRLPLQLKSSFLKSQKIHETQKFIPVSRYINKPYGLTFIQPILIPFTFQTLLITLIAGVGVFLFVKIFTNKKINKKSI